MIAGVRMVQPGGRVETEEVPVVGVVPEEGMAEPRVAVVVLEAEMGEVLVEVLPEVLVEVERKVPPQAEALLAELREGENETFANRQDR
tara:strand:+ start:587 stop:853 length:267 start_codon:yes stop_codon:yes gene_type:complete